MRVTVEGQTSASGDGVLTTTYEDDYIVRGNGYKINDEFELLGNATIAFALDLSGMPSNNGVFILPVIIQSSASPTIFSIYEADNYTGGTEHQYYNANRNYSDVYDFVVKEGVSGYETTTRIQRHWILASSTGSNINPSSGGSSSALVLNNSKTYIFEIANQDNTATIIEYDTVIYQVPFE